MSDKQMGFVSTYSSDLGRGLIQSAEKADAAKPSRFLIDFKSISPGVSSLQAGQAVTYELHNGTVSNVSPL